MIASGDLYAVKVGREWRILQEALLSYLCGQ